jgi:hypothetical protein
MCDPAPDFRAAWLIVAGKSSLPDQKDGTARPVDRVVFVAEI